LEVKCHPAIALAMQLAANTAQAAINPTITQGECQILRMIAPAGQAIAIRLGWG
jgi:hypothetical protein